MSTVKAVAATALLPFTLVRGNRCPPDTSPEITCRDAHPPRPTAPRALLFQDDSECSLGGGDPDAEAYPATPLTPISIAS